jgi:hypothetical protein
MLHEHGVTNTCSTPKAALIHLLCRPLLLLWCASRCLNAWLAYSPVKAGSWAIVKKGAVSEAELM